MGMFDFMKDAGEKIFKPGEAKREAAIKSHMGSYGGDYAKIDVEVDGNTARLTGSVGNQAAREKAVLIAGNIDGIERVDDRLTVTGASPVVDVLKTKRFWTVAMQVLIGFDSGSVIAIFQNAPCLPLRWLYSCAVRPAMSCMLSAPPSGELQTTIELAEPSQRRT